MAVKFANNVSTTLSAAINATQTTISVADASGLPTLSSGDYIYLTIDTDTNSPTIEVVKVTGVSTNTLTVVRGQDGTTASSFSSGTKVELRVTAAALDDISSAADTESVSIDGDTMTGALRVPAGSAASPSLLFAAGDLGLYKPATGEIAIAFGGNERVRFKDVSSGSGTIQVEQYSIGGTANNYPAYSFLDDPDTGLYLHGTGEVGLSVGSETALLASSTGVEVTGTISSGAITTSGPVSITGNASYVGNYGYSTLVLQDQSGYAGINFRHGNKNWLIRKHGTSDDLQFVYSDNASATATGTYTELFHILHDGGFDFKSGAFSNVGTISSGDVTSTGHLQGTKVRIGSTEVVDVNADFRAGNQQYRYLHLVGGATSTSEVPDSEAMIAVADSSFSGLTSSADTGWLVYRPRVSSSSGRSGHAFYTGSPSSLALKIDSSQNATFSGTITSGAITSTGTSSLGSQTLYISTGNYVGINTTSHVSTVLNVLDVDDEDVTLRLHTNTNSHKPVIRMNAKNSAGNAQYGDIKWNPDSPSFNFHVPYDEATPTLQISDGAISVDGTISSGAITVSSGADQILTLDQYTTGWNYIGFSADGARKFYVGNNATDGFVVGSDDSGKLFKIDNFGTVNTGSANFITTGTISSGTISSGNIGIGDTALAFGSGVSTLLLQGTAANNRAGAVYFREQDGTATTALYSTNGSDGYGTVLGAYQGSIKFGIGGIGSSDIALTIDTSKNATFAGTISSGAITSSGTVTAEDEIHLTDASTVRAKLLLNASDRDNVELRAESLGSTMKFFTVGTQALLLDASQNATFAGTISSGAITSSGTGTFEGGGNTLLLKKGTGTPAIAFAGTASDPQTTALIEGISGGGLKIYTSSGTVSSPSWSPKFTLAANGNITMSAGLTVTGNLTVNGTTTTINTSNLQVEDKNIVLNYSSGDSSSTADGAGITIQDAVNSTTDATILWDASNDEFDFSHPVKVAGSLGVTNIVTNKVVKHNGTIFDDSNITDTGSLITLGSATTVSGTLQSDDITIKGGTSTTTASVLTFENYADTAHIKSKYTNPSATTETYLAFHTNKAGEENGTVSESMRLSGNDLSVNGSITTGNAIVGDQSNISMDASANGQLEIRGSGYTGAIALNSNDMHFYHNSAERGIVFGTNEANRVRITSGGDLETYYDLNTYAAHKYYVSTSDAAHQRADARDESGGFSRLYWYGVNDSGATSNFRHAWYDGNSYINVDASSDKITFDHGSSPLSLALRSISGSSNPVFMTLEGRNSSSQVFALEIANRGNHVTSSFTDKIDFSILNNGTYYYSALRFDIYGGVETKQHIGSATSPYAADDRYFKLTNDVASASGTLVTADNGNTWLNADGGKDLWLNWYSLNSSSSHADLRVGDGDGGNDILTVVGVDRRVGILDASPSYPLDVAGDIRGTGMVRADSGINVHSGRISTTSSNQTGGGDVETYYQPDGNNNHTWRLIAGGTNTGYGTGAGGLGFFYQSSGGGNPDYNLILRANQTSRFGGRVDIEHDNIGAEPYSGLIVKNTATSGDRLGGITIDAPLQTHYRYMLGGALKWQTRVGEASATDDWRLYSWTTASDILTVKPSGEGQLRLFKTGSSTQWTDTSGTGSIAISGYGAQSTGSNPTVTFSASNGGYAMFYLNRMMGGSETFSDSSARYFDFYRSGSSKVRMVMSASDEFGFYHATSTASTNVWGSGGTNFLEVADTGTTTLYALNVSNSAQVGGSNIFHAGYSNTWAEIPAGTRTDYDLKFKPAQGNYAGLDFRDYNNGNAGYLLMKGAGDANPTYRANGITLVGDTGDISIVQRTTTDKAIRFVTNNTTDFAERGRFAASGNFLVGTTAEGGLNNSEGSIRAAGTIDTGVGAKAAFRLYDGSTFKGGFGSSHWATGNASNSHLAILTNTGRSLEIYTGGVTSASRMTFEADGTIDNPSAKWARTYHQVDEYASGGTAHDVHTHWGVLCAGSDNDAPLTYTIIETNIDQDAYRMGGFTILVMDKYNDHKTRARIDLAGYWNPEHNGGFIGWGYTTTNPRERPTIYVMRNSTTGKVAFAYQHSAVVGASYPVILACDLWIGYSASAEADGKNWSIKQQSDLTGYTNTDQVNHVGGNGNYQNNDGSFVISKSSGTMLSHGSQADAIGFNSSYGTYIGANNRYVYSGTTSSTHPVFYNGSSNENILHNGGQINNTYNGDHTFTTTTTSAGIKVSNDQTGGPAIKLHSTRTGGTDWWLISNNDSNTDGAGRLQLWSNNYSFTAATFGNTNLIPTNFYTPTYITSQNQPPTFTTHTTGATRPTLLANPDGQGAHALVVNQPHSGYWSQIISTQRYGLNIDSHASDSSTFLLNTSVAGSNFFYVRGDGIVFHGSTTLHGTQGTRAGNASYYADGSNGANINYYSPNGAEAHMDCRDDGNHSKLHKYTYIAAHGYGSYKEAWWDGSSYHEIGSISDAIRTNGDFVASGNITAYGSYSDRRLKENIRPFENARELIKDINVHRFNYIGKDDDLIGVIAQEVEETLPQLVYELVETDSDEVRKAVRYDHLSAVLLKVVKEQDEEIQELKALVHSLLEKIK